jgi:ABC-2 type transport system permease protein
MIGRLMGGQSAQPTGSGLAHEVTAVRPSILRAVMTREWRELVRNRILLASLIIPPILLSVLPLVLVSIGGERRDLPASTVAQLIANHPAWADMDAQQVTQAFVLQQFLITFLILPGYIPLAIASYSIVGEKQTRSLEAVLATPIRTTELLTGKAIASVIPAIIAAWLAYATFLTLSAFLLSPRLTEVALEPAWLAAVLAFGPSIGLASVTAGLLISSRVNDPRAAQQLGVVVLLPLIGIIVIQTYGNFLLDARAYLIAALITMAISIVGLRAGARIFGRESILTRLK